MSETKFTPGPWLSQSVQPHVAAEGIVTVDMDAAPACWTVWRRYRDFKGRRVHRPICEVHIVGQEWSEAEANAHLIAAAPELYEALALILPMARGYAAANRVGKNAEFIAEAEAALRKARGEA